jgi:antirestriction protein
MEYQPKLNPDNERFEQRSEQGHREQVPRIYVASLSDYNEGRLHGVWLDAAQDVPTLESVVTAMLAESATPDAEEYAIHDFENFGPLRLGEYESLATVSKVALGITEHGPGFAHYASLVGTGDLERLDHFEDAYFGHFDSLEEYAASVVDDLGYFDDIDRSIPESFRPYVSFDVGLFAHDLEISGDVAVSEGDGGVYLFNGHE